MVKGNSSYRRLNNAVQSHVLFVNENKHDPRDGKMRLGYATTRGRSSVLGQSFTITMKFILSWIPKSTSLSIMGYVIDSFTIPPLITPRTCPRTPYFYQPIPLRLREVPCQPFLSFSSWLLTSQTQHPSSCYCRSFFQEPSSTFCSSSSLLALAPLPLPSPS